MPLLSQSGSKFDRFLYASINDNDDAPLSVLSALARQDLDAWQEAARLAQLPKHTAVSSLAQTIQISDSKGLSTAEACAIANRLVGLLPARGAIDEQSPPDDNIRHKLMLWLIYGIICGSVTISANEAKQANKGSDPSSYANAATVQQEIVPQPYRRRSNQETRTP